LYNKSNDIWYQALKKKTSKLWANLFFGGQIEIMSLWWWWWIVWWWKWQYGTSVTMPIEKIIDSITCWVKKKSNCANVLFS
jgi:hypothetical protein